MTDPMGWDAVAFVTSFQITMPEGAEVVFIVLGVGTGGPEMLRAASLEAGAAFALVRWRVSSCVDRLGASRRTS